MRFLLDTDHLSILQAPLSPAQTAILTRIANHPPADFAVSIISFHEQFLGAHSTVSRARTPAAVVRGYDRMVHLRTDYQAMQVIPFDGPAAMVFDTFQAERIRVGTMDLRIAAIALSRGLIVLTRNARDFSRVPGLQIQDWTV